MAIYVKIAIFLRPFWQPYWQELKYMLKYILIVAFKQCFFIKESKK